jgi:hypothetical protein
LFASGAATDDEKSRAEDYRRTVRTLLERLIASAGILLFAFALSSGSTEVLLVAAIAIAAMVVFTLAPVAQSAGISVKQRAQHYLESGQPAPSHPSTAGRPMTRAPAQSIATA